eukprot:403339677
MNSQLQSDQQLLQIQEVSGSQAINNQAEQELQEWEQWKEYSSEDLQFIAGKVYPFIKHKNKSIDGTHEQQFNKLLEWVEVKRSKRIPGKVMFKLPLQDYMIDSQTRIVHKHILNELMDFMPMRAAILFDKRVAMSLKLSIEYYDLKQSVYEDHILIQVKLNNFNRKTSQAEAIIINPSTNEQICKCSLLIALINEAPKL